MKRSAFVLGMALIFLFLPGTAFGQPLPVLASIHPVGDLVRQIGGKEVDVTVVVPAGASPHTFELTPGILQKFSRSRLFFMIGAGMEYWADAVRKSAGKSLETIVLSEGIPLLHSAEHTHSATANHTPGHSRPDHSANPHIWLDPVLVAQMTDRIARTLSLADPENASVYEERRADFQKKLADLDRRIRSTITSFRLRKYVAFHPAWDYFSHRYGLECMGVIEATPGRNPTPRVIADIIQKIRNYDIRAVFAEPQFNAQAAEVIAREAGVRVLFLDPIGGPGAPFGETYLDLMIRNLKVMQEAMQ